MVYGGALSELGIVVGPAQRNLMVMWIPKEDKDTRNNEEEFRAAVGLCAIAAMLPLSPEAVGRCIADKFLARLETLRAVLIVPISLGGFDTGICSEAGKVFFEKVTRFVGSRAWDGSRAIPPKGVLIVVIPPPPVI